METHFAPAKRLETPEIIIQNKELISVAFITELASATNNLFIILNQERQIVFANHTFLNILGLSEQDVLDGRRLGESLDCKYSDLMEGGCGTSEFCVNCGAANAILDAINGNESEKECRIITINNDAFDFMIKTKPFAHKDNKYILLSAIDVSDTKRKEVLERVFFHDILNTAGGLHGLAEILKMDTDKSHTEFYDTIYDLSDKLIKEIESHRMILSAESGKLTLNIEEINLDLYLQLVKRLVENNESIKHTNIIVQELHENIYITTDSILLQRVLINMIKNAAEASDPGDTVTVFGEVLEKSVKISVHNPKYIPKSVRFQIFQRSFSTKGIGRGIGTYSMKLFGEKYLKGTVDFTSSDKEGTTFFIEIPKTIDD